MKVSWHVWLNVLMMTSGMLLQLNRPHESPLDSTLEGAVLL
eukprot:SAG11_NODE_8887_length_966_cov_1.117647_1_plen_40_part_10